MITTLAAYLPNRYAWATENYAIKYQKAVAKLAHVIAHPEDWYDHEWAIQDWTEYVLTVAKEWADFEYEYTKAITLNCE